MKLDLPRAVLKVEECRAAVPATGGQAPRDPLGIRLSCLLSLLERLVLLEHLRDRPAVGEALRIRLHPIGAQPLELSPALRQQVGARGVGVPLGWGLVSSSGGVKAPEAYIGDWRERKRGRLRR